VTKSLEQVLARDRSLYGTVLPELINMALRYDRLEVADRASRELLEYEHNQRDGRPPGRGAHFLRAAVLLRLARRDSTLLSHAKVEFEHEVEGTNGNVSEQWIESAAIRGLMRLAKRNGSSLTPKLLSRLNDLERTATRAAVRDRSVAIRVAGSYQFVDPDAAYEWLTKLGKPKTFDDYSERILLLEQAGRLPEARELLNAVEPHEKWGRTCHAWLRARGDNKP